MENEDNLKNSRVDIDDRLKKTNELLQIARKEARIAKDQEEQKSYELELKEKEIVSLKDLLRKERELERESELVSDYKD